MTADELRAAAARLRALAASVVTASHTHWGVRPWQVTECADERTDDCPCIVYQGEYAPIKKRQDPPIQYVADAETPEHAAWIATLHPGVGHALADWLDEAARGYDATLTAATRIWHDADQDAERAAHQASFIAGQTPHHALALARLINPKEQQ